MNVRADVDSTLHADLPAACPLSALNAIMTHRYTKAQAAGKPAVARGTDNRGPAVSSVRMMKRLDGFSLSRLPRGRDPDGQSDANAGMPIPAVPPDLERKTFSSTRFVLFV